MLAAVFQEEYFVWIFLCDIFIDIYIFLRLNFSNMGFPRQRVISNRVLTQACLYPHLWDFYSITVTPCLDQRLLSTGFFNTGLAFCHPLWDFYWTILTLLCHNYNGFAHVSTLVRFVFHQQGFSHRLSFLSSLHPHENVQRQFYWKVALE